MPKAKAIQKVPWQRQAAVPPDTRLKSHLCSDSPKAFEFLCSNTTYEDVAETLDDLLDVGLELGLRGLT